MKTSLSNGRRSWAHGSGAVLGAIWLTVALIGHAAQERPGTGEPARRRQSPAPVQPPCCVITAIDGRNGLVAAREMPAGRMFQFRAPQDLLPQIRVGTKVWLDAGTGTV